MPPMRMGGMAMKMQPMAAMYEICDQPFVMDNAQKS